VVFGTSRNAPGSRPLQPSALTRKENLTMNGHSPVFFNEVYRRMEGHEPSHGGRAMTGSYRQSTIEDLT
jgi:hypothetical protein